MPELTHVFRNLRLNRTLEYRWDKSQRMYEYTILGPKGLRIRGLMSLHSMTERSKMEPGWEFVCCL